MDRPQARLVDAATKTILLDMIDQAIKEGWDHRRVCKQLELKESRAFR